MKPPLRLVPWYTAPAPPVPRTGKPHRHFERLARQSAREIAQRQVERPDSRVTPRAALAVAIVMALVVFAFAWCASGKNP